MTKVHAAQACGAYTPRYLCPTQHLSPPFFPPSRPSHPTHPTMVWYTLLHGVITRTRNHKIHTNRTNQTYKGISYTNHTTLLIQLDPYGTRSGTAQYCSLPNTATQILISAYQTAVSSSLLPISVLSGLMSSERGSEIGGPNTVVVGPNLHYLRYYPYYPHHHRPTIHGRA